MKEILRENNIAKMIIGEHCNYLIKKDTRNKDARMKETSIIPNKMNASTENLSYCVLFLFY